MRQNKVLESSTETKYKIGWNIYTNNHINLKKI